MDLEDDPMLVVYYGHTGETHYRRLSEMQMPDNPDSLRHVHARSANQLNIQLSFQDITSNNNIGFDDPTSGPNRVNCLTAMFTLINRWLDVNPANANKRWNVQVTSFNDPGTSTLATGGSSFFLESFHRGFAEQVIISGLRPGSLTTVDSTINVNFGATFSLPTCSSPDIFFNGPPPATSDSDFFSVMLHEITHALGFISAISYSSQTCAGANPGGTGLRTTVGTCPNNNFASSFDRFLETRSTGVDFFPLASSNIDTYSGPANAAISYDVGFNGANAVAAYGSAVGILSTNPTTGSAMSHADDRCYDTIGSRCLMRPSINNGETRRFWGPVERGVLSDLGYSFISNNDECIFATTVFTGSNSASTVGKTTSAFPPSTCSAMTNDMWFVYKSTCDGTVTFSTCSSSFASSIALYDTCSFDQSTYVPSCDSSACGAGKGSVTRVMSKGQVIFIRVGSISGATGTVSLAISCASTCDNSPMRTYSSLNSANSGTANNLLMNRFTPCSSSYQINTISITVFIDPTDGVQAGDAITFHIWSDADGDGNPLTGTMTNLYNAAATATSSATQTHTLPTPLVINGIKDIYVGVIIRHSRGFGFSFFHQTSQAPQFRAYKSTPQGSGFLGTATDPFPLIASLDFYDDSFTPARLAIEITTTAVTPPTVSVSLSPSTLLEGGGSFVFTFTRTGSTVPSMNIAIVISGTASSTDFTSTPSGVSVGSGSITIPSGQASATLTIVPVVDALTESSETVILTISADAAYTLGTSTATATITDAVPSSTPTVSPPQTPTSTRTLTASPSFSTTPSLTSTPSLSSTRSLTSAPSLSSTRSPSLSTTQSLTSTPSLSSTQSLTSTPSLSSTRSLTSTPSLSSTRSPSLSTTQSLTSTPSLSSTQSLTSTPSLSSTRSLTSTPSLSSTRSPSLSTTQSLTSTPSLSTTQSLTSTPSLSSTQSLTSTPSLSSTRSLTSTPSLSSTQSLSSTPSFTSTNTLSASPTISPAPGSLSATGTVTLTASPTTTPSFSTTQSLTSTPSLSSTRSLTSTPSLSSTRSLTSTPSLSSTQSLSSTPSFTSTNTLSASPTASPAPGSLSATGTVTLTASPTITPSLSGTATRSMSASISFSPSASITSSASGSITSSASPSITSSPSGSITSSVSPSAAPASISSSPSITRSATVSPSLSPTQSVSPSLSPSPSPSSSLSATSSPAPPSSTPTGSVTASRSVSPSVSAAPSPTPSPSALPIVRIDASPATLSEQSGQPFTFSVSRDGPTSAALSVVILISGTADINSDYSTSLTGANAGLNTFTVSAGSASSSFTFTPIDDLVRESDETISVRIQDSAAYVILSGGDLAIVTIADNDATPIVSVRTDGVTSLTEGSGSTFVAVFDRSPSDSAFSLTFSLSGTAQLPGDFTVASGATSLSASQFRVDFAAGVSSASVTFAITNDGVPESNESIQVGIDLSASYDITTRFALFTIVDDDLDIPPVVSVVVTQPAGKALLENSTLSFVFEFRRDTSNLVNLLSISFTVGGSATFLSTASTDYTVVSGADTFSSTSGAITIPAGSSAKSIVIQPKNDGNVEADETIILSVFGSTLYTISSTQGSDTAVITNDDGKPQVSVAISGVSTVTEGSGTVTFVFSRTGPVDRVLVVNFDITGTAAFSSDYSLSGTTSSSTTSGSVSFNVGAATANVILSPSADVLTESKETVIFTVSSGSADYDAGTPSSATANINDKAPTLPVISITSVASSVAETVASTTIRIGRSGVLSGVVNVVIGITGTATVKTDYTLTPGVVSGGRLLVTVPSFSSSLSVTFKTINDVLVEGDETAIFTVTPQSSYIVDPSLSSRTITIVDNDFAKRDLHERNALPENSAFLLSSFSSFVMSILSFLFLGFF